MPLTMSSPTPRPGRCWQRPYSSIPMWWDWSSLKDACWSRERERTCWSSGMLWDWGDSALRRLALMKFWEWLLRKRKEKAPGRGLSRSWRWLNVNGWLTFKSWEKYSEFWGNNGKIQNLYEKNANSWETRQSGTASTEKWVPPILKVIFWEIWNITYWKSRCPPGTDF